MQKKQIATGSRFLIGLHYSYSRINLEQNAYYVTNKCWADNLTLFVKK
jgi:hypothetical protein